MAGPIFPFTAIVNQDKMKRALVLNAINPLIGGVLIRGERGTAKSTAVRALAALLPEISVVADCPFSCNPYETDRLCDNCRARVARGEELPVTRRKVRLVDLPVSATEDRVVGTLDIEQAIKKGEKKFEPGVLAAANRGILYVDEVNLLDDHVVDLLLDSAAMGVNVVEREGISFQHPAQFVLVGTMNPEEGELRPQLLDRFGLSVEIRGIADAEARVEIIERRLAFESDPVGFCQEWTTAEAKLSSEIESARHALHSVTHQQIDLYAIAELSAGLEVDGHRADLVILKGARAHAALVQHTAITEEDILLAAELALPHRMKRKAFAEVELRFEQLEKQLDKSKQGMASQGQPKGEPSRDVKKKASLAADQTADTPPEPSDQSMQGQGHEPGQPTPRPADHRVDVGKTFRPQKLQTPLDKLPRRVAGKRSRTRTERKRGRYISSRPMTSDKTDLAFDATFRQAAPYQVRREHKDVALAIESHDLRKKVRVRRAANLILFVVDASWSMAAAERMTATKGAIMSLLIDAYQKRDRVGLVVFQKEDARLVLPPTSSVDLAQKLLKDIPVGGKTPLSAGLVLAHQVLVRERAKDREVMPLMIIVTDGAGNVSMTDLPPQEEATRVAAMIKKADLRAVVINTEHEAFDRGLAQNLAETLGGACYTLKQLRAEELYARVREEMRGIAKGGAVDQ